MPPSTTSTTTAPVFESIDLFRAGENGWLTGRIPVLARAADGTLLAAWEARRGDENGNAGDWGDIDIVMRRSEDGGTTWTPASVLADGGILPAHNTNLVVDAEGTVHLVFFINYAYAFHALSKDSGRTFSAPRDITSVFREFHTDYLWNVIAAGPGHGIVTRNGRLILPVWLSNGGKHHRPSVVAAIYSDDRGRTWQRSEIVPPKLSNMSETAGVELEDGSILFNIRSEDRAHRRAVSRSPDGAKNWSLPTLDNALKEPVCMGNLLRLNFPEPESGKPGRVLFCNPDSDTYSGKHGPSWNCNKDRVNLTLRISFDDCATWPMSRVLDAGIAGYCDLAHDGTDTIYLLYEKGGVNDSMWVNQSITFARLNVAWLAAHGNQNPIISKNY
ncbi:sialidase family protein [Geminisphaera colitermitum]|uniref:sialidase family protein n=1 Tax=Geminisphaera colitermitum TaxID=1148786 RepID=UPI000158C651|nr:sialidase family protein [Geminisphaera colitermitum]